MDSIHFKGVASTYLINRIVHVLIKFERSKQEVLRARKYMVFLLEEKLVMEHDGRFNFSEAE